MSAQREQRRQKKDRMLKNDKITIYEKPT